MLLLVFAVCSLPAVTVDVVVAAAVVVVGVVSSCVARFGQHTFYPVESTQSSSQRSTTTTTIIIIGLQIKLVVVAIGEGHSMQ